MKLTNKNNLPQPLVDAIKADSYEVSGDISTTTLIGSPRVRMLKKKFGMDIEEDASDYLWALIGQCVHAILERANIKDVRKRAFIMVMDTLKEAGQSAKRKEQEELSEIHQKLFRLMEKFFPEIEGKYIYEFKLHYDYKGFVLSGKFDLYDKAERCLYDYKLCSIYAYLYPESRKSWTNQTNVYAFMLRNEGYIVDDIKICALFRDWSASRVGLNPDYPTSQEMTIPIKVYSQKDMKVAIEKRMQMHMDAEKTGILPECTGSERWASANSFNIKKKGLKRRLAGLATEELANDWMRNNVHKYPEGSLYLEIIPGESKKCNGYCSVRTVCDQKAREDAEILRLTEE